MNSGKIVIGALAGIAVGAVLGILFAPDKGSETRSKIAQKGQDCKDTVKNKLNDLLNDITEKVEKVGEQVSHLTDEAKAETEEKKA